MDTKPPPKPRRTLTEEQLGKKRRIDKLKHRENRAENKTRLENIERDVSFLRDTIGDLLLQLRQLNHGDASSGSLALRHPSQNGPLPVPQPPHAAHAHAHAHTHTTHAAHHSQLVSMPKSEPWNSPETATPITTAPSMPQVGSAFYNPADHITERLYSQHIFPQEPLESQMDMEALLADIRGQGPLIECRCGKQHHSESQCTERITVIMAVEFNNVSNNTSMRTMSAPRDPSLPDMLLHDTEMSNPLAAILSSILRQYDMTHIDSLCGIFFLTYRLLRVGRSQRSALYIGMPSCIF